MYLIKIDGLYIYDKMTCRNSKTNEIKYILWKSLLGVAKSDASIFSKEEVDYMKKNFGKIKIIKIGG